MREDAARDAMRAYGFEEGVIKVCIKELLEVCACPSVLGSPFLLPFKAFDLKVTLHSLWTSVVWWGMVSDRRV